MKCFNVPALLPDGKMGEKRLFDKTTLIFFYAFDFDEDAEKTLREFSDRMSDFEACDVDLMSCSTDSAFNHFAWIGPGLAFPMLADKTTRLSKTLGVLDEEHGVAIPGVVLVDKEGQVLKRNSANQLNGSGIVESALQSLTHDNQSEEISHKIEDNNNEKKQNESKCCSLS